MKARFIMANTKKADKKAENTAANAAETKADVGVETPAEEGPAYPEGVSMTTTSTETFAFAPIPAGLDPAQRQAMVLDLLEKTKAAEGRLDFIQGELLFEANHNGYWKTWQMTDGNGVTRPYNSFEEFTEDRLGMKRRTAYSRIDLYSTFVLKLKIPPETLADIDLSKAAAVCKIVKEDNWPAVLDAIKSMSHAKVIEFVKNAKSANTIQEAVDATMAVKALPGPASTDVEAPASSGAASKDTEGVKSFSVKLAVAQFENVKAALAVVKTATGTDSDAQALDVLASEYLAANSAGMKKQEVVSRLIQNIEATYGVVMKIESVPDDWNEGESDQE